MSYLKAIWLRPAAGALVVLAITALWLMGATTTEAVSGSVVITPATSSVGVGGTTTVSVDITAPDGGLSVWIVEIGYNPAVVQVDTAGGNPVCTTTPVPGTAFHGEGCAAKDAPPAGGANDTAVTFGAWVSNVGGSATGWTGTRTVATFTFRAVGTVGQSSPLTVNVCSDCFLRPNATPETPTEADGMITITAGTTQIWGNSDCSAPGAGTGIGARDVQALQAFILERVPGLTQTQPCPLIGQTVTVSGNPNPQIWGNWDCSAFTPPATGVGARDVQALQAFILERQPPLTQTQPCPVIGSQVTVS